MLSQPVFCGKIGAQLCNKAFNLRQLGRLDSANVSRHGSIRSQFNSITFFWTIAAACEFRECAGRQYAAAGIGSPPLRVMRAS
jgi:hypothetical protein